MYPAWYLILHACWCFDTIDKVAIKDTNILRLRASGHYSHIPPCMYQQKLTLGDGQLSSRVEPRRHKLQCQKKYRRWFAISAQNFQLDATFKPFGPARDIFDPWAPGLRAVTLWYCHLHILLENGLAFRNFHSPICTIIEDGQAASSQGRTLSKLMSLELTNIPITRPYRSWSYTFSCPTKMCLLFESIVITN